MNDELHGEISHRRDVVTILGLSASFLTTFWFFMKDILVGWYKQTEYSGMESGDLRLPNSDEYEHCLFGTSMSR
jgi:hypothetical protein